MTSPFDGISIEEMLSLDQASTISLITNVVTAHPEKLRDAFSAIMKAEDARKTTDLLPYFWENMLVTSVRNGLLDMTKELVALGKETWTSDGKKAFKKKYDGYSLLMLNSRPTAGMEKGSTAIYGKLEKNPGSAEMARLLVENGTPINEVLADGKGGMTALSLTKNPHVVKELIALRADVNKRSSTAFPTPLHAAVQQHCPEKIEILLDAGADVTEIWNCRNYGRGEVFRCTPSALLLRMENKSAEFDDMINAFVSRGHGEMLIADCTLPANGISGDTKARIESLMLQKNHSSTSHRNGKNI